MKIGLGEIFFVAVVTSISWKCAGGDANECVTTGDDPSLAGASSVKYGVFRFVSGKTGINCPLLFTVCVSGVRQ